MNGPLIVQVKLFAADSPEADNNGNSLKLNNDRCKRSFKISQASVSQVAFQACAAHIRESSCDGAA